MDKQRIVGNAVPPPLSKALGDELYKVLVDKSTRTETKKNNAKMQHSPSTMPSTSDSERMIEDAEKGFAQLTLNEKKTSATNSTSLKRGS